MGTNHQGIRADDYPTQTIGDCDRRWSWRLSAGIQLREAGFDDLVILEKARRLAAPGAITRNPALLRSNVTLVTDAIARITPQGIEIRQGETHDVDVIVYATGFETTGYHWSFSVIGRRGAQLSEVWGGTPQAYLGITTAQFPNLFMLYG